MVLTTVRTFIDDHGYSYSALAQEAISGGMLVKAMSGATVLTTSNALDSVFEVAKVDASADEELCVGVAVDDAASGERLTVYMTGVHGLIAGGTIVAGRYVLPVASPESASVVSTSASVVGGGSVIGKALSAAGSTQLTAVKLVL